MRKPMVSATGDLKSLKPTAGVLDPTPEVPAKVAVGSIWATIQPNLDERVARLESRLWVSMRTIRHNQCLDSAVAAKPLRFDLTHIELSYEG